ncbi:ribosomal RNA large subunit methyltransferase E [Candidatus Photodesmus katoptron]|uniref:23S rRNA (uridine(2552)-2'-O)-methyltransferase RlmE n=1 Tax=Candidatus Photodesmus anomalopis TaxID=28176 RepID=UPI0004DA02CF|nr:23S rRNA (uridine(2552)-2'-O)-methyltransferase RlmE [Candidatus Photodesmus katoptron]KEY90455.1 ribosomal RNA large subunit methyltransferase E [Candidatus Photodesmus katoptron]
MSKKNSGSSARWLKEHFDDRYANEAKKKGYRSRSVFKIQEIQNKDKLLEKGMTVVDLGAAPGGWSQYVIDIVRSDIGQVIACDILPINSIPGVTFLQGDIREKKVFKTLLNKIQPDKVNVILSDMAPNMTGHSSIDQSRTMHLVELALNICRQILVSNGSFVVKLFQGEGFEQYLKKVRNAFKIVKIRKPNASRSRSKEVYIVASGYTDSLLCH